MRRRDTCVLLAASRPPADMITISLFTASAQSNAFATRPKDRRPAPCKSTRSNPWFEEVVMARRYNLMSSDGHLEVPPERWLHRVPEKHRDRAPHTVHLPDGGDAVIIEGQPLLEANFLDLRAGRAEGTWQPFGLKVADAAGTGSPEPRAREHDQDRSDAAVP